MENSCLKTPEAFYLFDNVVLHVLILFTIVSALFVFFISKIAIEHINHEFISVIDNFVNPKNLKKLFENVKNPQQIKGIVAQEFKLNPTNPEHKILIEQITNYIISMQPTDIASFKNFLTCAIKNFSTNEHKLREETNKKVYEEIALIIGFLLVIAIIINVLPRMMGNYCGVLKHLGIELLVIFACVGIIEFWFFTNVATKYVPVGPTVIISTVQSKINKLLG